MTSKPHELDGLVHHAVLRSFVERGRAPAMRELAETTGVAQPEAQASLQRLHDGHGLVLHPGTSEVWLAHPFSTSPTAVWVEGTERGWWAPCLWCALGIVVLAAPNALIRTRIAGEHEAVTITLREGRLASEDLVVHFPIPARDAWNNVVHWCASVQPFRDEGQVAPWCERHGFAAGDRVPLSKVLRLAGAWYGRHLDIDWKKWSLGEAQAIFERVGLKGDHWALPLTQGQF